MHSMAVLLQAICHSQKMLVFLALQPQSAAQVTTALTGAKKDLVLRHLDTLTLMGEAVLGPDGKYRSSTRAA